MTRGPRSNSTRPRESGSSQFERTDRRYEIAAQRLRFCPSTGTSAGLYCFTTRERLRGRGLASALVHACHERARARGVERALLHATALGRPVYSSAGYAELRSLPLLVAR